MIYLDTSNSIFLRQDERGGLWFVPQDEALLGADWYPFEQGWNFVEEEPSPQEIQKSFDILIRCQAPTKRLPAHLRE